MMLMICLLERNVSTIHVLAKTQIRPRNYIKQKSSQHISTKTFCTISQKSTPSSFCHNFIRYRPIFI